MFQETFYWIFNMSIIAAITGAVVMLLRLIKMIPRRLIVFLWIIPFLRMSIPFGLNSPYSLMSLISKMGTKTVVVYQPFDDIFFSMTNSIKAAETYFPITYKVNVLEDIFEVASIIWLIVFIVILITLAITYFTTFYELKASTNLIDNVYFSEKIISPAVYGIIKPKIILPETYKDRDINLILLHEKTHIKSLDNLWRLLALIIVAVHWFNPLCWLFLKEFLEDIELSCDECVLLKIGAERKKEYATLLLESKQGTTVFASALGSVKIRTRIENILSFKKLTWISLSVFIVLVVAVFYVLLTNAG